MARIALTIVDWFVALTAAAGGFALVSGAEAMRFPPDMLRGTPFSDYLVPGLILAVVVGGSATAAGALTWLRPAAGARASVAAGLVLMGWIAGEVVLLGASARSWLEPFYFALGLSMLTLGLLTREAV
jgi:hypothetical protein